MSEVKYDINAIRRYIAKCEWRWAKTYLDVPHEYIVRGRCPLTDKEFFEFLKAQVYCGEKEWFGKRLGSYLYIDGYKYWTMGGYSEENRTMNRQKVFGEFSSLKNAFDPFYTNAQLKIICGAIKQFGNIPIFEFGCNNGKLIDEYGIPSNMYYGVDPNKEAINVLKSTHAGFSQRASVRAFEESHSKWEKWPGVIVGTFGSPSYVMRQYLEILREEKHDYFLMFYRDEFCPGIFSGMHHFRYGINDLRILFPKAYIYPMGDYITVSSKEIDWHKANAYTPIQTSLFD